MSHSIVNTTHGNVHLEPCDPADVERLNAHWPMGVVQGTLDDRPVYGLVFQNGDQEQSGATLQQVDCPLSDYPIWMTMNSARLVLAVQEYRRAGFGGILAVGVYARETTPDQMEPGIALFPVPDITGPEGQQPSELAHIDQSLGHGCSRMILAMGTAISHVTDESLMPFRVIDIDVRRRLDMQRLRLDLLVHGTRLYCLRAHIEEHDPFWDYVAKSGMDRLLHLPSVTAVMPAE